MLRRIAGVLLIAAAAAAPAARADDAPTFNTVRLAGSDGQTESRMVVDPQDRRYVVTNTGQSTASGASFGIVKVWSADSADQPFTPTGDAITGQSSPTIDVDIVATRTGRLIASELDTAGPNFPTSYSDDHGKTWTQSVGSQLADEDRQWFVVGPDDPATKLPTVYELWHNFASGFAQHNMWVQKSTDAGATFGPPVPVALPGSDAYTDLQCADSGGPSSISVNPKTGRVYVVFTTRAAPSDFGDLGGCGTATGGPIEFNIVAGTRVWVATSLDDSPGSWHDSLAQDDGTSNRIVSMQLAYGALDSAGTFYVAYPETPRPYPDFSGAAVRYRFNADQTLEKPWSAPRTLVGDGGPGNLLTHLMVGDPGRLAVAYFAGRGPVNEPNWYAHVVETQNGLDAAPTTTDTELSPTATYEKNPANSMMGACAPAETGGAAGIYNGLACGRSTDVWGVALDHSCRVLVTFPVYRPKTDVDPAGTYVSQQTGGPTLCTSPTVNQVGTAPPADGLSPPPAGAEPGGGRSAAALARRIKIQHLSKYRFRLVRGRVVLLRAKVVSGTATDVVATLSRITGKRRVLIARTTGHPTLTTTARTLRLVIRRGAHVIPGRYASTVTATIAGKRVVRTRVFRVLR